MGKWWGELTDTLVCGLDGVRRVGRYCLHDRDLVIRVATLEGEGSGACDAPYIVILYLELYYDRVKH